MALKLNAMMITSNSKSKSHKSYDFLLSLPLPKPRSSLFTSTLLPYKSNFGGDAVPAKKSGKEEMLILGSVTKKSVGQLHSTVQIPAEKTEMFKSMEGWATTNILPLLKPVVDCWQPQDFLPDPTSEDFHDELKEIRARTEQIPDDFFVVLVGDMITEEALPSYHSRLNGTNFFHDQTGVDQTPWAAWSRGWSAEENRHGDLLNKYLYLSGRVNMKHIETTIQYLIGSGMDIGTGSDPYLLTIYTSFQERATAISHGNTAKLAMQHGDIKLAQICGTIASDEKRHETAYSKIAEKLFELDPNDMVVAFARMMRRKISMPAHFMYDGCDDNLFQHFSHVASRIGVYTATDYRKILEHLLAKWNVERLTGLSGDGREAQDYICRLPQRFNRLEERAQAKAQSEAPPVSFSWICGRQSMI